MGVGWHQSEGDESGHAAEHVAKQKLITSKQVKTENVCVREHASSGGIHWATPAHVKGRITGLDRWNQLIEKLVVNMFK